VKAAPPVAGVAEVGEVDSDTGLSSPEAARRLLASGPNELVQSGGTPWPRELARQLTPPLALLLWGAAALVLVSGSTVVAIAVVIVIRPQRGSGVRAGATGGKGRGRAHGLAKWEGDERI
jgi:Cation transporter/ATPase, N-terminus